MPALHDMICSACGFVQTNMWLIIDGTPCGNKPCKGRMEILWTTHYQRDAAVHSKERTHLYYSAKEGKWQYPSESNKPIPDRLQKRGYERVEFSSLRSLEQHGKQTGAISERAWFDKGSGRSLAGD